MARKLLWASLALAPVTILVDKLTGAGDVTLFVLAALSLIPLAWLIGEVDRARGGAHRPGHRRLPQRELRERAGADRRALRGRREPAGRRARLARGERDLEPPARLRRRRRSSGRTERGSTAARCSCRSGSSPLRSSLFVFPAALGYTGEPERHAVVVASMPVAIVLLLALRRGHRPQPAPPPSASGSARSRARAHGRCRRRSPRSAWRPP